jgi:TolB-like protein
MRRSSLLVLLFLFLGLGLPARAAAAPSLAVLPLQEEGRKDLGDISRTMTMCVTTAFTGEGRFQLVDPGQVQAALAGDPAQGSADPAALARRVGAQYALAGTFLPESNLARGTVTVTVTLRLVEAASGKVVRYLLETQEGPSLGGVVAGLSSKLSAKSTPPALAAPPVPVPVPAPQPAATPLPAPQPVAAPVPMPAVPAPVPAAKPASPAPTAAPAPEPPAPATPLLLVPTIEPAPAPAAVPAPKPAAAAAPRTPVRGKALLVLREGRVNGVYYQKNGLDRFGVKLEDLDFLLKILASKLPGGVQPVFDVGSKGPGTDFQLNSRLVKDQMPDAMAVLVLETKTKAAGILSLKHLVQASVEVMFLDPRTLEVISTRLVSSDFWKAKGVGQQFPQELKDELAAKMETVEFP